MKILSISTDRNILQEGSAVRARQIEYGRLFDEMHIIIFSTKAFKEQIAPNVWIYSTHSFSKFLFIRDGVKVAKQIATERGLMPENTVITTQDPFETGLVGLNIKRALGFRLHVQIHTDFLSPYFSNGSFLNSIRATFARRVLPKADAIRVVSKRIADSLRSAHFGRSLKAEPVILPIFVDVEKIAGAHVEPGCDPRQKYPQFSSIVLMASRLTREKNIPLALKVFADVLKTHPKAGLVIVGQGPERGRLVALVQKLDIEKSVVFEPWQADLVPYYKTANLFLLTSDFEGYGMTIVEAVAAGCPVVSTDVGVAPDLISHVCPVRDGKCLSKNIISLIGDARLLAQSAGEASAHLADVISQNKETYLQAYKKSIESTAVMG